MSASQPQPTQPEQKQEKEQRVLTMAEFQKSETFRKFIEVEILDIIRDLSSQGAETEEKVQQIAQLTLEKIKVGMTIEELFKNAIELDDSFSELSPVTVKVMQFYEQNFERKAVDDVASYVRMGNYQGAQDMVQKILEYKIIHP
jgi:Asp-tRNA(Asn)/Glu-tRNA(Gln) amidotransferase A subunit family amidase